MKQQQSKRSYTRKRKQYRHLKSQRGCLYKQAFKTYGDAEKMIETLQSLSLTQNKRKQKQAERLRLYTCLHCDGFHITKRPKDTIQ